MGDIQNYLYELFDGLQARGPLMDWINGLKGTPPENHTRLGRFMEQLEVRLTLAQVDRQKALALLDGIGNGFMWKTSDRDPGVWSGRGLRSFVKSFDTLEDQEGLLRFHDRGKFSDILAYLDEILGEDPVLAALKEEVHRMFQEATAISEDRLERRVELAVQAMDRVAQYVRALAALIYLFLIPSMFFT